MSVAETPTDGGPTGPPSAGWRRFNRLFRTTLILIPIGVLGNILFSFLVTDRELLTGLPDLPRGYLYLAIVLGLVPWITNGLRLLIWARFLGHPLRLRDTVQMTLAVDLGSAISPTALGGGFFKWGMLVQRGVSPGAAASLTAFPTVEDGIFFAIALPIAIVATRSWNLPIFRIAGERLQDDLLLVLLIAAAIGLLSWLVVRLVLVGRLGERTQQRSIQFLARTRRRLRTTVGDATDVFRLIIKRGKSRFALSFLLTAIQWSARYSVVSALIAYLGYPVQPLLFWLLQWVVFTLMTMIPTPGAAGGAEAAFYVIYSAFIPAEAIGLATTGWRFLTFYFQLGFAAIIFLLLNLRPGRRQSPPAAVPPTV